MLKAKLESLDGLDESLHSFYKAQDDGTFSLQVDGLEDTTALKNAKTHEKEARKAAEARAKAAEEKASEMEERLEALETDGSRKRGDVESLEKSWKAKLEKREAELQTQIEASNGQINNLLVDNVATQLAAELAVEGSSGILLPHIKGRLGVEERDGKFVTVIKDAEGNASALTLDELKDEFVNNKAFAPVIVGSKASGSGASGGQGGGAAKKTVTRAQFDQMSAEQKMTYSKDGGSVTD